MRMNSLGGPPRTPGDDTDELVDIIRITWRHPIWERAHETASKGGVGAMADAPSCEPLYSGRERQRPTRTGLTFTVGPPSVPYTIEHPTARTWAALFLLLLENAVARLRPPHARISTYALYDVAPSPVHHNSSTAKRPSWNHCFTRDHSLKSNSSDGPRAFSISSPDDVQR